MTNMIKTHCPKSVSMVLRVRIAIFKTNKKVKALMKIISLRINKNNK